MVLCPIHFQPEPFRTVSFSTPARVSRTNAFPEEPMVLQYLAMFLAICDVVDDPDSGSSCSVGASSILIRAYADIASLACPAHPGSLASNAQNFRGAVCDADEPCSVDTAKEPESSFTTSPRSTTRPFFYLELMLQL